MFLVFEVDFLLKKKENTFLSKIPEKPQIQSCITQVVRNNKKWVLKSGKNTGYLFFPKSLT